LQIDEITKLNKKDEKTRQLPAAYGNTISTMMGYCLKAPISSQDAIQPTLIFTAIPNKPLTDQATHASMNWF